MLCSSQNCAFRRRLRRIPRNVMTAWSRCREISSELSRVPSSDRSRDTERRNATSLSKFSVEASALSNTKESEERHSYTLYFLTHSRTSIHLSVSTYRIARPKLSRVRATDTPDHFDSDKGRVVRMSSITLKIGCVSICFWDSQSCVYQICQRRVRIWCRRG